MSCIEDILDSKTLEEIVAKVYKDDKSVEVMSYKVESFSKSTVGFLGSHNSLEITVKRPSNPEPVKLKFFVKTVPHNDQTQTEFIRHQRVFDHEAEFFNKLMPQLLEAVEINEIECWAPKCYLANSEVIVLEDLRTRDYSCPKIKSFDGPSLEEAVKTLARLHAASILLERRLGKPLGQLFPNATREQIFSKQLLERGGPLLRSLMSSIAEKEGRKTIESQRGIDRALAFVSEAQLDKRVICHGDAWPNNVMFNSDRTKCILVDYQIVRYAPRMFDVAELIYLSTSKDVRIKELKLVLKSYWNELCETLRKCEPGVERPSLEELEMEYEEAKIAGLLYAILVYPTILVDEKLCEEHDDVSTFLKKFVFRRDNDCIMEWMVKDKHYEKRITEVVMEFLDLSETLGK